MLRVSCAGGGGGTGVSLLNINLPLLIPSSKEWPGGCRLQRGNASRHSYSKRIAALNDATTNLRFLANRWAFPMVDRAEYMGKQVYQLR